MKKKGFTLIELLAVIVILAVLLVIAVPKILDVIESAEKNAYKASVELIAHTAQIQYQTKEVTGSAPVIPEEGIIYTFEEGIQTVSGNYDLLKFKGDKPYQGTITLTKDKKVIIDKLISKNTKWCAIKEVNEKHARVGRRTDPEFNCKIDGEDEINFQDENECELATNDDKTIYYIDSPSDLYAFSKSVNSGEQYSGKTIKVRNNLDMSDTSKMCGEDYFHPIGTYISSSNNKPFSGTFDGGGKTISGLTINSGSDYTGLFGYVKGESNSNAKIFGVVLDDIEVTGNNKTGGLIGYSEYTTISEILINYITVEGADDVGGLYGKRKYGTVNNILLKNGSVKGSTNVGSVTGDDSYSNFSAIIIENMQVDSNDSSAHPLAGNRKITSNTQYSNNVIVNKENVTDGFDVKGINDINMYESVGLDTWIGGEDGSGYYFDYDKNNKIILKSTEKNPITFNLIQDADGYYLIKDEKDWKEASTKIDQKYKIENNLDFTTNKYYMLGSYNNQFIGTLNGNDKIISNVTINGNKTNYLGLIGYANKAIIHSLDLRKITINGFDYTGLFGYVNGTSNSNAKIFGVILDDIKVTGNNKTGGLIGYSGYTTITEILLNYITVEGADDVGGLYGKRKYGTVNNILLKNGSVKGSTNVGSVTGDDSYSNFSAIIIENMQVDGNVSVTYPLAGNKNISSNTKYSNNVLVNKENVTDGFDVKYINDINYYATILETPSTGDTNNTGYIFDYVNDKGSIYLIKF